MSEESDKMEEIKPIEKEGEVIVSDNDNNSSDEEKPEELMVDIFGDNEIDDDLLSTSDEKEEKPAIDTTICDFDIMMEKKRKYRRSRRRQNAGDSTAGQDEYCAKLVDDMFRAAEEDRINVKNRQMALSKFKMIEKLRIALIRTDRYESLVDHQVHGAIMEWLRVLPDGSLPNIRVRRVLMNVLYEWPRPSPDVIESSEILKILTLLSKHSKETVSNRRLASDIIYNWTKPSYRSQNCVESMSDERDLEEFQWEEEKAPKQPATLSNNPDFFKPRENEDESNAKNTKTDDVKTPGKRRPVRLTASDYPIHPPKREVDEHATAVVKARMRQLQQAKLFQQIVRSRTRRR